MIHLHFPEQRYAYDIGVFKDVRGERRTFDGDEFRNESYFCWDQPIHCVKDATVLIVSDDVPDNFGHRGNRANADTRNSCIAVEHEGQTVAAYFHVRQGSAAVKAGQRVRAGQVLGRVGNAGASSEPHLHFAVHRFDATGRYRNVPVNVVGLSAAKSRVRAGVPKSPAEYRCTVPR